jgi:hypothetical protein
MAKKRGPGRPKKPASQIRSSDLRIPVTPDEKKRVLAAAKTAEGRGELADWARNVLLREADRVLT